MTRVYTSAVDHINNHPYMVMVNSSYSPAFPDVYMTGELEPIYTNPTPQHPVRAMLPIKYLIDLHATRRSFTIIEEKDVIRVFHSLDAYLIEIAASLDTNPLVKNYAEKVLRLRVDAYKNFVRVLNRHPEWKAAYLHGTEKLFALFDLFAAPDFRNQPKWRNPIEQLELPPIHLSSYSSAPANGIGLPVSGALTIPYTYA